jgi:hypothetical protein
MLCPTCVSVTVHKLDDYLDYYRTTTRPKAKAKTRLGAGGASKVGKADCICCGPTHACCVCSGCKMAGLDADVAAKALKQVRLKYTFACRFLRAHMRSYFVISFFVQLQHPV